MLTLILVRHAKTEQLAFKSSKTDFERKLKPRGFTDTELVADELIRKVIKLDLLITSKAVRADQTATLFANKFDIQDNKIIREQFIYDGYTTTDFITYLSQFKKEYATIMVVGHNPEIAMMAINITDSNYLDFPTTATAVISFDVENWKDINAREGKLEWLITPKVLK